jgi:aminoglycoside phosphotransferase (APT) family kinase protein
MDLDDIAGALERWARDCVGPEARIHTVTRMPGNAGFSFGFHLDSSAGAERLVIRLPPPGAAYQGNADVLRQAVVLDAMATDGVKVPAVRWQADDNPWFESPFYIAAFVQGKSTHLFDNAKAAAETGAGLEPVFRDALATLVNIHDLDWRTKLPTWDAPASLEFEIERWKPSLRKSPNGEWVSRALEVADRLIKKMPEMGRLTVVHGDFYSNNWLFGDDRINAIVDWEIATIGPPGLDVGWLCMVYDEQSWGPLRHMWPAWNPTPEFITEAYEAAGGEPVEALDWCRALAGYRLACITGRNYELHVSGKRPDPAWDILGDAFLPMINRAAELLED